MIGLVGPQRCGKSTLAQAFAQVHGIPFVQTGASEVFALLGKDPKVDYPVEERLAIQEAILFALERQYAAAAKLTPVFIADRCPIDLASYMMADIQRSTLAGEPAIAAMVNDYVRRCLEATNRWFSTVVLVQPGIALVEAVEKAPACPANIEHINLIQSGLLLDDRLNARHYMIPRRCTDLQERVAALKGACTHAIDHAKKTCSQRDEAGILVH